MRFSVSGRCTLFAGTASHYVNKFGSLWMNYSCAAGITVCKKEKIHIHLNNISLKNWNFNYSKKIFYFEKKSTQFIDYLIPWSKNKLMFEKQSDRKNQAFESDCLSELHKCLLIICKSTIHHDDFHYTFIYHWCVLIFKISNVSVMDRSLNVIHELYVNDT